MKLRPLLAALVLIAPAFIAKADDLPAETFLAQAYLIKDLSLLDDMAKPDGKELTSVKSAKRGEQLHLIIAFTYPKKDKAGNANVTYSFTMTDPNGKAYPVKDVKGLEGALSSEKQKTWMIIPKPPTIALTAAYPPGVYKFRVAVRDEVAKDVLNVDLSIKVE